MLKFFVSLRPIRHQGLLIMPSDHLDRGFQGIDIKYEIVAMNLNIDGRILYMIIIGENEEYLDSELQAFKEIILEGLQGFGCHLKSAASAEALFNLISSGQVDDPGIKKVTLTWE